MVPPQHLLSFTTCNVCNVHLPPDWVLEAHYATTDLHPKCDRCGLGFREDEEFGWVCLVWDIMSGLRTLSPAFTAYF